MKMLYQELRLFFALLLFIAACGPQILPTQTEKHPGEKSASYEVVLGKPMTDNAVMDFIAHNNCYSADHFQLCKEVGMALWIDAGQIVKTIYLYAGNADGFRRYQGELPFGLSFYDPMWRVQEKLKNVNTEDILQHAGLPDEVSSADRIHYWAVYQRLEMTIIYNSPFADEDAYIYAIWVSA